MDNMAGGGANRGSYSGAVDSDERLLDAVRAAAARAQSAQRQVMQLQAYADSKVTNLQAAVEREHGLRLRTQAEVAILMLSMRELEASLSSHMRGWEAQNMSLLRQAQALRTLLSHSSRQQQEQMRDCGVMQARLTQVQADKEQLLLRCARLEAQRNALRREVREHIADRPFASPSCRRQEQAWQVHDSRAHAECMAGEALQIGLGRVGVQMARPRAAQAEQPWCAEAGCMEKDRGREKERRRPLVAAEVEMRFAAAERGALGLMPAHTAGAALAVAVTASDGPPSGEQTETGETAHRWQRWSRELQRAAAVRILRAQQVKAAAAGPARLPAVRDQASLLDGHHDALPVLGQHNRDLGAIRQLDFGLRKASARREVRASGGSDSTSARGRRPGCDTGGPAARCEAGDRHGTGAHCTSQPRGRDALAAGYMVGGDCGNGAPPGGVRDAGGWLGMLGGMVEQEAREAASEAVREAAAGCSAWSAEVDALTRQLARVESSLVEPHEHPSQPSWGSGAAAVPPARSGAINAAFTCVEAEIEQLQLALALATQYAEYTPVMQAQIARFSGSALADASSSVPAD